MPRDAFGREQDEDALAHLASPTPPAPAPAGLPSTFTPPPLPLPSLPARRGHGGGIIAALFGLIVTGALVFGVVNVIGHVPHIHLPSIPKTDLGASNNPPSGLDNRSLLRRGNLAPALRKIEAKVGGEPRLVRIEADRLDVQVVSGGKLVEVQYRWNSGSPDVLSSSSAPPSIGTFTWSQVNASAPARLVRATTRPGRTQDFEYAVLVRADQLRWTGYTATGGGYLADAKGRNVTTLGG